MRASALLIFNKEGGNIIMYEMILPLILIFVILWATALVIAIIVMLIMGEKIWFFVGMWTLILIISVSAMIVIAYTL